MISRYNAKLGHGRQVSAGQEHEETGLGTLSLEGHLVLGFILCSYVAQAFLRLIS